MDFSDCFLVFFYFRGVSPRAQCQYFNSLFGGLGNVEQFYVKCAGNPLTNVSSSKGGLNAIRNVVSGPKEPQKRDSRVTGSDLIDKSLQDILGYIVRDYIEPWYNLISANAEFTDSAVRHTAQSFAINISNRVKEIDWIPYLTQRLVDDAASHLRLFKQARTKMKQQESLAEHARQSQMRDVRMSPKRTMHKRNKSETDVSWYIGRNSDLKRGKYGIVPCVYSGNDTRFGDSAKATGVSKKPTLEEHFFELECQMEKNLVCRDVVCMDKCTEEEFLSELVEILLYVLLPDEDFQCKVLRYMLRDVFANGVLRPLFDLFCDPDYINQIIIWLCLQNSSLSSDIFLTVLRLSENSEELRSVKDLVCDEMQNLRSRDTGGDSDLSVKQQLSSLTYVTKLIDNRLLKIENAPFEGLEADDPLGAEDVDLTLHQILKDNLGLSHFMDFATTRGKHCDLFFYLNIEGWKDSVRKELADLRNLRGNHEMASSVYKVIRSTASDLYEEYLGSRGGGRSHVDAGVAQILHFKIRNLQETPSELWFDEVERVLLDRMERELLPAFKRSKSYVKLLHELDLVPQGDEEGEGALSTERALLSVDYAATKPKHTRSFSDVVVFGSGRAEVGGDSRQPEDDDVADRSKNGDFTITVSIIETGIVCEKGKTFGIYALRVGRQYETGFLEEWHVYRRYSDFYDLHARVKGKFPDLSKLAFPGKKTFHNMDRAVLERRMKMLDHYVNELTGTRTLETHEGLRNLLSSFLEQGEYDRATGGPMTTTINTLVSPLRSGMKSIKQVPEQLISTMDEMVGGLSKVFHGRNAKQHEAGKVGESIEETDDNVPLRIMLLLMDEVFDLKSRNQWLRRRMVTLLRQILRTMFGDIVNRRILDYVSHITSPKNVAHYLHVFKQSFWPNGVRIERKTERSSGTKNRTRVAAKAALLASLSDELKHIIGSETSRRGLLTVFELFQRPVLNRRLIYVLVEGMVCTLFPEKDMASLFRKLHSRSKRSAVNVAT
ncbi:sorting nexin-13-like isoform X2 [Cylas formicarius]|uniref:sorting nexin-13-like isoform X2 n=1 Tax=Cylas formicarius TaxID=197179 RepID=UPI00295888FD|nr:sorting nexin-13-like isoform X2 [Cylas formicarius]